MLAACGYEIIKLSEHIFNFVVLVLVVGGVCINVLSDLVKTLMNRLAFINGIRNTSCNCLRSEIYLFESLIS